MYLFIFHIDFMKKKLPKVSRFHEREKRFRREEVMYITITQ